MDDAPTLEKKKSLDIECLRPDDMRKAVVKKLSKLQDSLGLEGDCMVTVARHYNWREDKLSLWFDEQEKLIYKLGLEPNPNMDNDPKINVSLYANNPDKDCLVCCDTTLDESNEFML